MSTPIKPPGSPPPDGGAAPGDGPGAARVERRPGELRELVESAKEADVEGPTAASTPARAEGTASIEADLRAGRIDVDEAIDRLVERSLANASGLSSADRARLEAHLRAALAEDPTLIALRKDLVRGSQTS